MTHNIGIAICQSPLGQLHIHASAAGIHTVHFPTVDPTRELAGIRHTEQSLPIGDLKSPALTLIEMSAEIPTAIADMLQRAVEQLQQYFAGSRQSFDLPLTATGTAFQQQVWQQLCSIAYGHTESYGALALQLGNKNAMRAVGAANGRNPIAIIVPCHRVIGADGKLTGYAGGLNRKLWLLQHEQFYIAHNTAE